VLVEVKASWRTHHRIVAKWEMAVGVGIASARSDVRRVENVYVDQFDIGADLLVPFSVSFLHMLAPELHAFEELRALRDFAAVFVDVFLLNEL